MYCAQNNRIYCSDCKNSYFRNNYSNHLKSKGHYINVMRKQCCGCNNDITHRDNHDLTCCMNKVSLETNDSIKTDFSNVKKIIESNQTTAKDIGSEILLLKFSNHYDGESSTEGKEVLQKLYNVMGITLGEYVYCRDGYVYIRIKM